MLGAYPRTSFDRSNDVEATVISRNRTALALVAALLLAAPAVASASTASLQGYGTPAGVEQVKVAGSTGGHSTHNAQPSRRAPAKAATDAPPSGAAGLPFTGFDVLLVVFAGLLLLAVGLALRWMAQTGRPPEALR
jgi:hypothetical protein